MSCYTAASVGKQLASSRSAAQLEGYSRRLLALIKPLEFCSGRECFLKFPYTYERDIYGLNMAISPDTTCGDPLIPLLPGVKGVFNRIVHAVW
jgi:hypothetical protein